jgi:hypothetical protein
MPDPATRARGVEQGTRLESPLQIRFAWQLSETGSRLDGVGVARIEPPYRARLDLFLENGESVLSAALVDGELRLPPGARDDLLPPVDLMWGVLGVFRPGPDAEMLGGDQLEGAAERLRYRRPDGTELHYEVADGRVRGVELLERGHVVQWVRVTAAEDERYPAEGTYRNLVDYRELKLTRQELQAVESFDPDIWDPRQQ